jgi:hypothetical protein
MRANSFVMMGKKRVTFIFFVTLQIPSENERNNNADLLKVVKQ